MALTKRTIIDKIELVGPQSFRALQVREDNQIIENGEVINGGKYHRYVLVPGFINEDGDYVQTDVSSYDQEIRSITGVCWTDQTHTDYEAYLRA